MTIYQKITLLPRDTNSHGTIFGGVIMSYLDLAGAACCRDHFRNPLFTTVVVREVVFRHPVRMGDVLTLRGQLVSSGRTSVTVRIEAWAQSRPSREEVLVTAAELVYVAIGEDGQKTALVPWEA